MPDDRRMRYDAHSPVPPSLSGATEPDRSGAAVHAAGPADADAAAALRRGVLEELMAPDWAAALAPVRDEFVRMGEFLQAELAAGRGFLPVGPNILRAFHRPLSEVRVLVVGQDPYPTPGHSVGLCFAVDRAVRPLPRSLKNIYRELHDDLGIAPVPHGDLTGWACQGVLLLNRVLTVAPGLTGSHRRRGWERITTAAITVLAERGAPLVAVLWGNDARSLSPLLSGIPKIESAHPSPLAASRGFFGSRPFSRTNALLAGQGGVDIDWALDGVSGA